MEKNEPQATALKPPGGDMPDSLLHQGPQTRMCSVDMNEVIGKRDILMLCLDTLRWDVAKAEQDAGGTPLINRYGTWVESFAPGDFTYPSHHAIFTGYLPAPVTARSIVDREMLFFPQSIGMGRKVPPGSFAFAGANLVEGLAKVGYQTNCIGGVYFFDKRSDLGRVFPAMFQHSFWRPSFGCMFKESIDHQVEFITKRLDKTAPEQCVFYYLNISAIHYPNWYYLDDTYQREDSPESHAAALRYVDSRLEPLLAAFKARGDAFIIALSDHGTCYHEDGYLFHGFPHPMVNTVPYKHFFL